jgi:nitrate reductase assembly molybdenum cofactor insertion protein NarJ
MPRITLKRIKFYKKLGFEYTRKEISDELVMRLEL